MASNNFNRLNILPPSHPRAVFSPGHFFEHRNPTCPPIPPPWSFVPQIPPSFSRTFSSFDKVSEHQYQNAYRLQSIPADQPTTSSFDKSSEHQYEKTYSLQSTPPDEPITSEESSLDSEDSVDELMNQPLSTVLSEKFTDGMIRFLLDLYKKRFDQLSKVKNNRERSQWWADLASTFNEKFGTNFNKDKVRTKVNNLKQKLKKVEDNNKRSGAGAQTCKMHEDLQDAFGNSPGVSGPTEDMVASGGLVDNREYEKDDKENCKSKKRSYRSAADRVFSLLQENEENALDRQAERLQLKKEMEEERERKRVKRDENLMKEREDRHNERMQVAKGLLSALNKLVEKF